MLNGEVIIETTAMEMLVFTHVLAVILLINDTTQRLRMKPVLRFNFQPGTGCGVFTFL